jgi:hypothetical protein
MKRLILTLAVTAICFCACKKSNSDNPQNNGLPTAAETKPQFNNTSFGVYKGVIIGSSGTIIFRINNGDNIVKGYLTIDSQKDTLSTTATLVAGQPISNVLFVGRISSMRISANANGSNAMLSNIQINGHNNVTGFIIHENSNKQVLCYEGTFTGGASGVINATRVGLNNNDTTFILSKVQSVNDTTLYRGFGGTVNDTARVNLYLPGGGSPQFQITGMYNTGNFNPNTFNGTWSGAYGNGQFTSQRTY